MFNNSARDSAALDRYITGENSYGEARVIAKCPAGHSWPTVEVYDMGGCYLRKPECPECKAEADRDKTEPDDGSDDEEAR